MRSPPSPHTQGSRRSLSVVSAFGCSACVCLSLVSSEAFAFDSLTVRGRYATGLRVEECPRSASCRTLVHYPQQPARTIHSVASAPSGRYFFVWSTPDRQSRELDVYERANNGVMRIAHWSPGFGGELRWVDGDHLWHTWGCGAPCVNGQLYDPRGRTVFSEPSAAALWESPDRRFAAFAFHGGSVVVVRFASLRTSTAGPSPRARFPYGVASQSP